MRCDVARSWRRDERSSSGGCGAGAGEEGRGVESGTIGAGGFFELGGAGAESGGMGCCGRLRAAFWSARTVSGARFLA